MSGILLEARYLRSQLRQGKAGRYIELNTYTVIPLQRITLESLKNRYKRDSLYPGRIIKEMELFLAYKREFGLSG